MITYSRAPFRDAEDFCCSVLAFHRLFSLFPIRWPHAGPDRLLWACLGSPVFAVQFLFLFGFRGFARYFCCVEAGADLRLLELKWKATAKRFSSTSLLDRCCTF